MCQTATENCQNGVLIDPLDAGAIAERICEIEFARAGAMASGSSVNDSIWFTRTLPTITASATCATAWADSGSLMPKPTPTGSFVE